MNPVLSSTLPTARLSTCPATGPTGPPFDQVEPPFAERYQSDQTMNQLARSYGGHRRTIGRCLQKQQVQQQQTRPQTARSLL